MVDVAKSIHLLKRGNTWHYFRRVPKEHVSALGKTFIKRSLRTSDLNEARRLRNIEDVKCDQLFLKLAAHAKFGGVSAVKARSDATAVSIDEILEYVRSHVSAEDQRRSDDLRDDPPRSMEQRDEFILDAEMDKAILADPSHPDREMWLSHVIERIARDNGIDAKALRATEGAWEIVRHGLLEIENRRLDRYHDNYSRTFHDPRFDPTLPPQLTFQKLAEQYLVEKAQEQKINDIGESRADKVKAIVGVLRELVGDGKLVSSIDGDCVHEIKTTLALMPANRVKLYPSLSLHEAIKSAEKAGRPTIAFLTQRAYLAIFKEMLDLAVRKKVLFGNPALGVKPLKRDHVSDDERRDPFTLEQIRTFFTGAFYRQCANPETPYTKNDKAWRFWLPLVMLFSAARPQEVCQLRLDDIKTTDGGTPYLDIVVDGGGTETRLKTKSSRRKLPLHPVLIDIGFLDFVAHRRSLRSKNGERLFHELKPGQYGNLAAYPAKRFREAFLPQAFELGERQSFYSIRHSVRDALRRIHASPEALEAIGGWSQGKKNVSSNYGDAKNPDIIRDWVEKIDYPGLDLSYLKGVGAKL